MVDRFRQGVVSLVLAAGAVGGCGLVPAVPGAEACPEIAAWLPDAAAAPPAALEVTHDGGSILVRNTLDVTITASVRTFVPADCAMGVGTAMPSIVEPGHEAGWEIGGLPGRGGPAFAGLEIWLDAACPGDDGCGRPPDAFRVFQLPAGP